MSNFLNRKQMYKSSRGSPPPWKDIYRKKCFERLRARRANLIEQFRFSNSPSKALIAESTSPSKLVSDVMELEWSAIHQSRCFPSLSSSSLDVIEDSDEEGTREVLEQIQNELQSEDEMLLNEFLRCDSDYLSAKIEMFQNEEVICPVCKVRRLKEQWVPQSSAEITFCTPDKLGSRSSLGMVKCECGLAVSGQDLNLSKIRSYLQAVIGDHESNYTCLSTLQFTLTEDSTAPNILITCPSCEWMTFLL